MKLGFMQGRLVDSEKKNSIQYFPSRNWKKEIIIANKNQIELIEWTINYENINLNPLFDKKKNLLLLQFIKKNSIDLESVTCDFFMQKPFFKNRRFNYVLNDLEKVINLSSNFNIKYFILPLVDNSSIENENQEEILIKDLLKLSKKLKKKQKFLFEIDYSPKKILILLKKLNNKFGINYDTGNSASLGYKLNDEKIYFEKVHNIHIKDRIYKGNTVRLGKGNYNFKQFFKFLKKIKYDGNLILQTARSKNHLNELKTNINFIKNYL